MLSTGAHRLRFVWTPHLPHGWDAGHLYDETTGVLFCSDLLHQNGDVPATTTESRVPAMRAMLEGSRGTPLDWYVPWTPQSRARLERLAELEPRVCATMHGSAYLGRRTRRTARAGRDARDSVRGRDGAEARDAARPGARSSEDVGEVEPDGLLELAKVHERGSRSGRQRTNWAV